MSLHCLDDKQTKHKGFFGYLQSHGVVFDNVDLPDDLPMPHLSSPPQSIPKWNRHNVDIVEAIFEFNDAYLHNMLLFCYLFLRAPK